MICQQPVMTCSTLSWTDSLKSKKMYRWDFYQILRRKTRQTIRIEVCIVERPHMAAVRGDSMRYRVNVVIFCTDAAYINIRCHRHCCRGCRGFLALSPGRQPMFIDFQRAGSHPISVFDFSFVTSLFLWSMLACLLAMEQTHK